VCAIDPPDAVVQAIQAAGGDAMGQVCDVSDPKAVAALVQATEQAFGGVQVAEPAEQGFIGPGA
jgi:NAD(P)-dependent dehydrogenase (short-subunit alcohol dehydrogenase family)